MKFFRPVIFATGLLLSLGTYASANDVIETEEAEEGTFTFVLENDLFFGLDQDYTNGVQLAWMSEPDYAPVWALKAARLLPFFPEDGLVRSSYAIGQNMYTPNDISDPDPPLDERPYAGWLYGAVGIVVETGEKQLDQLQLQFGIVGPSSLAEQSQEFIHKVVGSPKPQGWDTQLKDEPGLVLTYQRSWRALVSQEIAGISVDVTPHVGGALGNIYTYANAGATLRFGWNLPNDYGPPRIQPGLPGSGFFEQTDDVGLYFFAGLDARAVAHNIFLDGNTFRDSRSVDKEPFVGDAQVGVAVTLRSARLAFTHVFRSREYKGQSNPDEFGAISLSVPF
ncbi:lipid A deacylase LpxR family protein [uncultured Sneathiella sp.]|jgi:hypothetical protein|uniref:lipid A deacylase LpxR family protein n=1 Tax=uncultured Sneathiella sp. TaxID=879315 RepID=UPI0030D92EAB|tara:strand:- start:60 stop:1070 length:1011 start_codon:yes stop_codon:yes gene_type:complete